VLGVQRNRYIIEVVDKIEKITNPFGIRTITDMDRGWIVGLLTEHWGSTQIVTRGRLHQADELPGFMAFQGDDPVGLITYRIDGRECEIISLNSLREGIGIGTALLNAVREAAVSAGCRRFWMITTNDNQRAIRFYQKYGFTIAAIHRNALEQSRKLKPSIPLTGIDGIPLKDEIEMEIFL